MLVVIIKKSKLINKLNKKKTLNENKSLDNLIMETDNKLFRGNN